MLMLCTHARERLLMCMHVLCVCVSVCACGVCTLKYVSQGYETITVEDEDDIEDITGENGMLTAHRTLCKYSLTHSVAF
jgi:hypothetical protein